MSNEFRLDNKFLNVSSSTLSIRTLQNLSNKLQELKKYFLFEFKMTKAQYDREIVRYTGPDLINFYYRMEDKYKKYARVAKPSPRLKS